MLTLPAGSNNNGIFGGMLCQQGGVLVSGGFQLMRTDVVILESFIGPAFGRDRIYVVNTRSVDGNALSPGDVVKMWVTCI